MPDTATASAAPGDELLGTTLGDRYKIVKRLGQGGMGVVFLGRHAVLDSLLAVKVLLRERNEIDQQRFLFEARLASKINHPNTVSVVAFGVLPGGRSYLVMEYLKGDTLDGVLAKG